MPPSAAEPAAPVQAGTRTVEAQPPAEKQRAPVARRLLGAADRAAFEALTTRLGGRVGLALAPLRDPDTVQVVGRLRTGVAWSTSKVPVAVAAVEAGTAPAASLRAAITASDNVAATRLWASLGTATAAASAATEVLRAGGDATTQIESRTLRPGFTPFGQTTWRLADQVRYAARLSCTPAGRRVRTLMGQVVAGQRWGIAGLPGARVKGGWGPGVSAGRAGGYLVRQFGTVRHRGGTVVVAVAATAADLGGGVRKLDAIADWVSARAGAPGAEGRDAADR
ncbi:hypothetical protein SK069_10895 [Patulibacter brassicae]|uniref:Serine hydrolase n=1 Tax=Patulibacter brassicae TaxID=1705717 RepID=A0ABU4VL72_9ACTN|nr:hypothetical protein [Patulibacter brassicae]MDX8152102.1 hypothetical protein [Patulibacter brassicae]